MLDERFHDEIDACRPGSRDLDEPEMAQLAEALTHDPAVRGHYEAVQRLDARLVEAFAAVAVPTDLAARLIAGLQSGAGLQQTPAPRPADEHLAVAMRAAESPEASPAQIIPLPVNARRPALSRRRLLIAIAASIVVATGLWARFRSPATPAAGELTTEAAAWFEQLADNWQPIAEAPADLPLPAAIVGNPHGWQTLSKAVAGRGVAYRLAQGAKTRAVLFVLSARRPGLPSAVPLTPQSATGGLTIGAWQSQGLVYVLVVDGDEQAYRRLLHRGRQPLA